MKYLYRAKFLAGGWKIGTFVLTMFHVICHVERYKESCQCVSLFACRENVAPSNAIYVRFSIVNLYY
jgi:hypothetical protein